jgi:NAD(P)-dependent dehydrogenase (short-subunit alcohol dehydrogenase family)
MPTFDESRDANVAFNPSYVPVMVVTGATGGIGQAMLETLARHLNGRIHIVLVGRNRAAAETIIAGLPTAPESKYEFIQCDVLLMKNVHALAADLLKRLPKINFLVHCAGNIRFWGGRKETEEGIDDMFAVRYYNRFALTLDLLPLLRNAAAGQEAASVLCVLGAGLAPEIDLEDLGMKKNYWVMKAATQTVSYNDLMVAVSQ